MSTNRLIDNNEDYLKLNAKAKILDKGKDNFSLDKEAADLYIKNNIKPKMHKFNSTIERYKYLIENNYYEQNIIDKYTKKHLEELNKIAYSYNHEFHSFMGAFKFFQAYALKSFDHSEYLETYTDRVIMNALFLANGDFEFAKNILDELILGRYQPATPTFLNAGKKQRGEYISCYLLRIEDNMESISRAITTSLQLSKRGGGVALCLTNLRETGAPIKNIQNQSSGIIPVMKILEDSFSYANQLGQRQGAGAVYLNIHHPDVEIFLDSKRENADEKIRLKSLSLGLIITNIAFELAKNNQDIALFSPYDIYKEYKKSMSDISITEKYYEILKNSNIKKTYINARKLFQKIAELHFESGYPYLLFDDIVNENNAYPNTGRIVMSNLCSEIVQVNTPSEYSEDLTFKQTGEDVCCNLGSINIAKLMENGNKFETTIFNAVKSLDFISRISDLKSAPSILKGNTNNHAIGLGAMNLHGFLATNKIYYNSEEAIDFTNIFFYTMAYHAFKSSNILAQEKGIFHNFKKSKMADGSYFDKYTNVDDNYWKPRTKTIKEIFEKYKVEIPTVQNWKKLVIDIKKSGLANSHLMAIAPTGSISYLSSCTPSLQPVVAPVEIRKEGKLGRVYVPAYKINFSNIKYYALGAYELGPNPIIDIVSTAQFHVDQAISLTLFMTDKATTRDLNKAYIYAYSKNCKSIYYVRIRQDILENSENFECDSCMI